MLSWTFFIPFGKQTPNFNQKDLDQAGLSRTTIEWKSHDISNAEKTVMVLFEATGRGKSNQANL
ncbi:MAG TPA: hypothetical protein ENH10_00895 [Bacteroidetes bacterium]|nr:hypothetical protein [Bacteroidota bacterium]HEX03701.1 hypothetical protein [Bacteroidota bacterium]